MIKKKKRTNGSDQRATSLEPPSANVTVGGGLSNGGIGDKWQGSKVSQDLQVGTSVDQEIGTSVDVTAAANRNAMSRSLVDLKRLSLPDKITSSVSEGGLDRKGKEEDKKKEEGGVAVLPPPQTSSPVPSAGASAGGKDEREGEGEGEGEKEGERGGERERSEACEVSSVSTYGSRREDPLESSFVSKESDGFEWPDETQNGVCTHACMYHRAAFVCAYSEYRRPLAIFYAFL